MLQESALYVLETNINKGTSYWAPLSLSLADALITGNCTSVDKEEFKLRRAI